MLTSLLYRVKSTHSLKPVISAGVRSPAPSGQEMDGDACLLRGLELQRLSDLFWDITLGSMLTQSFFFLFLLLCSLLLLLYFLLPFPGVTCHRVLLGGCAGLWHRCLPGTCRPACISMCQWRHLLGFSRSSQDEQGCFNLGEDFRMCSIISSPSFSLFCGWHCREAAMPAGEQRGRQPYCELVPVVQLQATVLQRLLGQVF